MDDLDGKNLYLGYEWEHADWAWSLRGPTIEAVSDGQGRTAKRYKIPMPEIKEESRKEEGVEG